MEIDWLEDWEMVDDYVGRYEAVELYKVGSLPNSKLITYDIKVDRSISNVTKSWEYKDKTTLNCVIYNLISCMNKGTKLIYSRRKVKSTSTKGITSHKVVKAVDFLEQNGYIVNFIGVGSKQVENRMPSYIQPTDKLKLIWQEKQKLKAELDYLEQMEGVELRDEDKEKSEFRSNKSIKHMMDVVTKLNKMNEGVRVTDRDGNVLTNIYCRIFNETFDFGGRFYRADVLAIRNKKTDYRLDVKIDGKPVCEVDFSNLHFRIAAALEEYDTDYLPLDVYSGIIPDETNKVDRDIVKRAVNIMFNCENDSKAHDAIRKEVNRVKNDENYTLGNAKSVMALIRDSYPDFSWMFCNTDSFGRVLQNHDSHLASDILEVFIDKRVPCLPVHDSFLVQREYMDLLCDTMGNCFRSRFNTSEPVPVGVKWRNEDGSVVEHKMSV